MELEPAAERVVRGTKNTLVSAGPGAGKTELLAQRACFLLETGLCPAPKRILAISFKRDAAKNLGERVALRCGPTLARRFDSYTFDAFAKTLLDQFAEVLPKHIRPTIPYEIVFKDPSLDDLAAALSELDPPDSMGRPEDVRRYVNDRFFRECVLPLNMTKEPTSLAGWCALQYWHHQINATPSRLTFSMITCLARALFMSDERVRRMLLSSYSHVLLDEFQDTTEPQLRLVKKIFTDTATVLTAVGDKQQMIMGWAGAVNDGFERFLAAFDAEEVRLQRNRRASADLSTFVEFVSRRIEGQPQDSKHDVAAVGRSVSANFFATSEDEASWIAQEICEALRRGAKPRELGVLVRMKARDYGAPLIAELSRRGVHARVEDLVQEVLAEPAAQLYMVGLRALSTASPGAAWATFRDRLSGLRGVEEADERSLWRLEEELRTVRREMRTKLQSAKVAPPIADYLSRLDALAGRFLQSRHPQYRRGDFLARAVEQLGEVLTDSLSAGSWESALDRAEGLDAVPILTIHKSKGLEYQSVFFVGLEDGAFWNFTKRPDEEMRAFFVALSRAEEKVAFTFTKLRARGPSHERQSRTRVESAYAALREAGATFNDRTGL
jgi:superfamily I DNA/RNA helicase